MTQITNTLLMVRPHGFRMNEQTAINNYYQQAPVLTSDEAINKKARMEFDALLNRLIAAGVQVVEVSDTPDWDTPDALFPNNWVSFHQNGTVCLYPMFAENRRLERREDILELLETKGFVINQVMDYTRAEKEGFFLEGTGSLVLDRINRKAYCALSPRADEELLMEFCEDLEYLPVAFTAYQTVEGKRLPIYHTNVMMCVAEDYAVVCLDSIDNAKERKNLINHLKEDGKTIVEITEDQVAQFAGNMLQVLGAHEERFLVMSESAYKSLNEHQLEQLTYRNKIIFSPLDTIETCGGGSARCMMAEVFLPKNSV